MASTPPTRAGRGAWWTVGVLGTLYILSFVDRLILALLVQPMKADLGVSDVQLGLLFGPAFAVFYAVLGLPAARLADRGDRRLLVFGGVMLWGLATVASGFAGAYWVLVMLRMGLAIGEAALTPAAYSMIGDLFPPSQRPFAASIYSGLGMAGSSAAYILGAGIIQAVDMGAAAGHVLPVSTWQLVLLLVGAPALLLGLVFVLTVREPARTEAHVAAPSLAEVGAYLGANARMYVGLFLGAGLIQAISYAYTAWGPELMRRQYGLSAQEAGALGGLAGLFAGVGGTIAAPIVVRWLERRGRADAIAITSIGGMTIGAVLAVAAPLQPTAGAYLVVKAIDAFFLTGAANNVIVALQTLAPSRMRATLVAILLMSITLLGLGVGPTAAALISTALDPTGQSLGRALAWLAPLIGVPALALLVWSRRALLTPAPPAAP